MEEANDNRAVTVAPAQTGQAPAPYNPFGNRQLAGHVNAGAVSVEEQRAIAEAQGKLILAKKFPRDQARAYAAIMEACKRPGLAAIAEYSFPRGNERVTGPSIRLAEELARCWGNMSYGIRELSRKDGVSEMEAWAWDEETNVKSSQVFTVRHIRDTRNGPKALTDERDVYELTANMAGRRLRARIMAVLPADIVDAAVHECRRTIAGDNTLPMVDRVRKMIAAFDKLGISAAMIERKLGKTLTDILPEEFAELTSIHNSIKDGISKAGDWFDVPKPANENAAADINSAIRAGDAASAPKAAPTAPQGAAAPAAQPAKPPAAAAAGATPTPAAQAGKPTPAAASGTASQPAAAPAKNAGKDDVF